MLRSPLRVTTASRLRPNSLRVKKLLITASVLAVLFVAGLGLWGILRDPAIMLSTFADDFYTWPVERQVAASTVIARGEWRIEGDEYKCIIAEIIKRDPGVSFDYNVGDEFRKGNQRAMPHTTYGEGQVLFFGGSPPTLRFITAVDRGRLVGLGETTLDALRAVVAHEHASPSTH
jgi:hypothetical protein